MRDFEIGDRVEFEVIYDHRCWRLRCGFNESRLPKHQKKFIRITTGKVIQANDTNFLVKPDDPNVIRWGRSQPGKGHSKNMAPNYLRLVKTDNTTTSSKEEETCTCSSIDLFNYGCQCGGK